MGIFREGDTLPAWCELTAFSVHEPATGQSLRLSRRASRERFLVTRGRCLLRTGASAMVLRAGQFLDLSGEHAGCEAVGTTTDAELLQLSGAWGDEVAGCGIWTLENEPGASNPGDPVDYPKQTRFDNHYHDYDEVWFVLEGAATAVVSGQRMRLEAGDCVPVGTGHHHDMPEVHDLMRGAFFETTLRRSKRLGHLWEHTHGPANPDPDRV